MLNYKEWLKNTLLAVKNSLDFNNYDIEVFNEQDYAKNRSIKPKTITVIVRFNSSDLIFQAKTQSITMLAITEENSISVANSIMTKFCETYNFSVSNEGTTYIKHMYSTPAVLSNFNLIGIGLRTVLYINTTLFILYNVIDINNLKVKVGSMENYLDLIPMSSTIGYTMSGDTQDVDGTYAKTVKRVATFVMTLNVACVKNDFTEMCIKIMNMSASEKGNETFLFDFYVGDLHFESFSMKMIGCTITTAVNNVPSLQLSFEV